MNRVAVPGSCAILAAGIAQRFWKKGWKDFGLIFGIGSAVCCYFCIWDLNRSRDPVYKNNLYKKRKDAYAQSLCRPITDKLLKPIVEKYGSLDILKNPMQGQQVMMQHIQRGEMALQQGMEQEAIVAFSMAACISYIGQGVAKAEQLLSTISNMIPQMGPILSEEFSLDKEAVDEFMKSLPAAKPLVTRENFLKSLQPKPVTTPEITEELDEDSIDESEDEKADEPKIQEIPEEQEEKVVKADVVPEVHSELEAGTVPEVQTELETEIPSTPEIITSQEVSEANQEPEAFSLGEEKPEVEDLGNEDVKIEEIIEEVKIVEEIIEKEEIVENQIEEEEIESDDEIAAPPRDSKSSGEIEQMGDAPVIEKVTINKVPKDEEMEDEELE